MVMVMVMVGSGVETEAGWNGRDRGLRFGGLFWYGLSWDKNKRDVLR